MKALRFEHQHLSVADVAKPLANGEALVRVIASGICNTDLEIAHGYAGFEGTLGHEFVGVIEELPSDRSVARPTGVPTRAARVGWSIGRALVSEARALARASSATEPSLTVGLLTLGHRVVGEINAGCGKCDLCRSGDSRHCARRTVLGIVGRDGAHAELLKLPMVNLHRVPFEIPDEHAVFTEPLAAACGILERTSIASETKVAVIGDGKLGLLCAQVVKTTGAEVTLIGKHESKLRIAKAREVDTNTIAQAQKRARQFDLVIEASGSPSGFKLALDLLHPRGVLVLKSTFQGLTEIDAARIVVDEISVIGSRCGRFEPALDLLKSKAIDIENLISEEFSLSDGVRAMQRAAEPGVFKILLRP